MDKLSAPTIIDVIRHGEPVGGRRYRGHGVDDPLSEKGWAQMWRGVEGEQPWQQIISSPMARCLPFARQLGEKLGLPVSVIDDLREVGFGDWEHRSDAELEAADPGCVWRFYQDPVKYRPAGAEPLDRFIARVGAVLDSLYPRCRGQQVLVVAHAGVMRAMIAHITGCPPQGMYRFAIANAARIRIRDDGSRPPMLMLD